MAFTQPRLPPLPRVFFTLDEKSPQSQRRTLRRSSSFSGYTPFELSDANFELDLSPKSCGDRGCEVMETTIADKCGPGEPPVLWPDTEDEEPMGWSEAPSASGTLGPPTDETESWKGVPVMGLWLSPLPSKEGPAAEASLDEAPSEDHDVSGKVKVKLASAVPVPHAKPTAIPSLLPLLSAQSAARSAVGQKYCGAKSELVLATSPQAMTPMSSAGTERSNRASALGASPIGSGPQSPVDEESEQNLSESESPFMGDVTKVSRKTREDVTTMMVRGVPALMTQRDLIEELNASGFLQLYDFCYLPRDFKCSENKGYAFVNFVAAKTACLFQNAWHNRVLTDSSGCSQQVVIVNAAVQGLQENMKKWCGPRMRRIRNPDLKPFLAPCVVEAMLPEQSMDRTPTAGGQSLPGTVDLAACSPTSDSSTKQVMQAMRAGAIALRKARAMMPAVNMEPAVFPKSAPDASRPRGLIRTDDLNRR